MNTKKTLFVFIFFVLGVMYAKDERKMEYDAYLKTEILAERANGFVATKEMAIKLAEIYLIDIYGERVKTKFPLKAILKDEIWYVIGSLPTGYDGGVPVIKISKLSGAVLGYIHFK